eukprot:TRINITY_DN24393_c0_g1_i1.p1 TRINITY_DN24393_c0_g1~~TRINITY_DN24393_c0_g1_i1.p1  ORF type:complete len:843 (+),score=100.52 TRINITY_DN24393_c0_g1_i1:78-2606(+)
MPASAVTVVWNIVIACAWRVLLFSHLPAARRDPNSREHLNVSAGVSPNALSICDAVQDAMPSLASEADRVQDSVDASCVIRKIEARSCISTSPLWVCVPDGGHEQPWQPAGRPPDRNGSSASCRCMWRPACHGIRAALGHEGIQTLVCRPDLASGACRCWGFRSCEVGNDTGWTCEHQATVAPGTISGDLQDASEKRYLQRVLEEDLPSGKADIRPEQKLKAQKTLANTTARLLKAGSCLCNKARAELLIPLSPRELEILQGHPYDEVTIQEQETAAGNTIQKKEIESDDNGKEQLTLTISDKKQLDARVHEHRATLAAHSRGADNDTAAAAGNTKVKDEDEHCVITDGNVSLGQFHFIMMGVMILPAAVATILISSSNYLSRVCLRPRRPPIQQNSRPAQPATAAPPWIFTTLIVLLMVLMKMNVSSILTTAHVIVDHMEDSGTLPKQIPTHSENPAAQLVISGLLLASEPLGGILGVAIAARCFISRPKVALMVSCAILCSSSLLFVVALRRSNLALMTMLRFGSGLAEGCLFIGHLYLTRLSSPQMRTQIFGYWEMGTAAGLVGGPALASVASIGLWSTYLDGAGQACAFMISLLAAGLFFAIACCCPTDADLCSGELADSSSFRYFDFSMTADKFAVQLMLTGSTIVRLFLRLAWEATAVMVLASHFCLGHQKAGYGIVATFLLYMGAQSLFMLFCRNYSDHTLVRFCEVMELVGLLMMCRMPAPVEQTLEEDVLQTTSWTRLGMFLLGSAMFYTGNCMTAGPLSSWATKHGPSYETLLFWAHLAIHFGVCAGGFLSRMFISMDAHQNAMVVMLLPIVIAQMLLSEMGMRQKNDASKD